MRNPLLLTATLLLTLAAGCTRPPDFPETPSIAFKKISKFTIIDSFSKARQDSVIIALTFRDGDGDLGVSPSIYPSDSAAARVYNYEVRTFRQKNGLFTDISNTLGVSNSGNFPRLRNDGKSGAIEGTLERVLYFPWPFVQKNDTLRFKIRIRDRALNTSNEIETTPVVIRQE